MALHQIDPVRETLHGRFSPDLTPVLTINSGDTVRYRLLDAGWGLEPPHLDLAPRQKFEPRIGDRDSGHALCGPVAIRGAQPGMMLETRIEVVQPAPWGWTYAGGSESAVSTMAGIAAGPQQLMRWDLDAAALEGVNQFGHRVALRPFLGVIGMPPAEPGWHSSSPPRLTGGNIDCKELVAGTVLYLPIAVAGALVSVGDGHALQGDGEVCGQAIECPMDHVELTFHLRDDLPLQTPHARVPGAWITFGFHEDLDQAMLLALSSMLDLMMSMHGLERAQAVALASLVVDLRITQVVNGVRGVHALLPDGALRS